MTVSKLCVLLNAKALSLPEGEREIDGVYIGDLLSWVMGRAKSDNVWITIMSNLNVVAVASLSDVACVVMAEGVEPESDIIENAKNKGVNIISAPMSAYEIAALLSREL